MRLLPPKILLTLTLTAVLLITTAIYLDSLIPRATTTVQIRPAQILPGVIIRHYME